MLGDILKCLETTEVDGALGLARQCMLPAEGRARYNYYVFSREPTWGWGHDGQVFHESLSMLPYALFDPRTESFTRTSGGGQHGMSRDDWGRTYVCGNSDPYRLLMYDSRYLARNPYLQAPPAAVDVTTTRRVELLLSSVITNPDP